ncbi:MAG: RNA polymerase sigma factor RpoH [Gammaproteobacteria bacterium]
MSTALSLTSMSLPSPLSSIDAYVQRVNQIPVLTVEEEQRLATEWYYEEKVEAARELVLSHLRFVVHVARGYAGYGLALADLVQEGNIGLMKAVKRFDPTVGVRLVTFAVHWIKAEINDFVVRNWRIVRVATTKAQRKLFFKLRGTKKRLGWFTEDEINQVASDLKVTPNEVREMEMRLQARDPTFDGEPEQEAYEEDYHVAPAEYLTDADSDPAWQLEQWQTKQFQHLAFREAWEGLTLREQEIVQRRWLAEDDNKATLHELAAEHTVSAERIRQIEQGALRKLQRALPHSDLLSNPVN